MIALKYSGFAADKGQQRRIMACQLICPNLRCRRILAVQDEARGKLVKCQYCQTMFRVPEAKRNGADGGPATAAAAGAKDHK